MFVLRLFSTLQIWRMPCLPMGSRMDQAMSAASPSSHVTWCSTLTPVSQTQSFLVLLQKGNLTCIIPHNVINIITHMLIEVPLRQSSINELGRRYYEEPARFHTRIRVAIAPDWHLSCDPQKAKPVSPPENIMAFLLSLDLSKWKYSNSILSKAIQNFKSFQITTETKWPWFWFALPVAA